MPSIHQHVYGDILASEQELIGNGKSNSLLVGQRSASQLISFNWVTKRQTEIKVVVVVQSSHLCKFCAFHWLNGLTGKFIKHSQTIANSFHISSSSMGQGEMHLHFELLAPKDAHFNVDRAKWRILAMLIGHHHHLHHFLPLPLIIVWLWFGHKQWVWWLILA